MIGSEKSALQGLGGPEICTKKVYKIVKIRAIMVFVI